MTNDTTTQLGERPPVETLSFEQAQAELEQIVEALEDRHTGLDEALALWERGEALHTWCQQRLDYAAERLQKLAVTTEEVAAVTAEEADPFAQPASTAPADVPPVAAPAIAPDDAGTIF
jgi:exodeoxyribonuclease VII small subunit